MYRLDAWLILRRDPLFRSDMVLGLRSFEEDSVCLFMVVEYAP